MGRFNDTLGWLLFLHVARGLASKAFFTYVVTIIFIFRSVCYRTRGMPIVVPPHVFDTCKEDSSLKPLSVRALITVAGMLWLHSCLPEPLFKTDCALTK